MNSINCFNLECTKCTRLAAALAEDRAEHPEYHAKPVPAFGDASPQLLIVGLAPGKLGAHRIGRPFTQDYAGLTLYPALHRFGLSNQPEATHLDDGLELFGTRITNAVKCWPPENKPTTEEVDTCSTYLKAELAALPVPSLILVLGTVAHRAVLKALGLTLSKYKFGHHAWHQISEHHTLLNSYHCSRYNTNTKRLTTDMFENVIGSAREWLDEYGHDVTRAKLGPVHAASQVDANDLLSRVNVLRKQ